MYGYPWTAALVEARSAVATDSARQHQEIESRRVQVEAFQSSLLDRERLLEAREDGLRGEIAALERHLGEGREAHAAAMTRLEESSRLMKSEHAAAVEELQRSLAEHERAKGDLIAANAHLQQKHELTVQQLQNTEAAIAASRDSLRAALAEKDEASAARDRLAGQLQATIDQANGVQHRQEREIALARSTLDALRAESSARGEAFLRELAEERAARTQAAAELVAAHARNEDLIAQRSDLRQAIQIRDDAAVVLTNQLEVERGLRALAEAKLRATPEAVEPASRKRRGDSTRSKS